MSSALQVFRRNPESDYSLVIMELEQRLPITNKYGLHARASTRLAQIAQKYTSEVSIARESNNGEGSIVTSEEVDAKSVLGILSLGAECGDHVRLRVSGEDAKVALAELANLVQQKFQEE